MKTTAPPYVAEMPWDVRWDDKTKRFYEVLHKEFDENYIWTRDDYDFLGSGDLKNDVLKSKYVADHFHAISNQYDWKVLLQDALCTFQNPTQLDT